MDKTIEQQPRAEGGRMNAESELKSCPFCGSVPERDGGFGGYVSCGNALCFMFDPDPAERMWVAEAAWNTRPAPTDEQVEVAAKRMWKADDDGSEDFPWFGEVSDHYLRMARAALGVGE